MQLYIMMNNDTIHYILTQMCHMIRVCHKCIVFEDLIETLCFTCVKK